ncbi:4'-phosphopantetheinyl transferase superfamily protein [Paracoccus cavernae]|uniref:4'-phosphopantetheinyl transferase superfamily protein n=1 Tax=Paracoccus cavernae TaxID=1571207 RepID=UPI0036279C29
MPTACRSGPRAGAAASRTGPKSRWRWWCRTRGRQILGLDLEPVMPRDLAQQLAASLMPEARAGGQGMPAEIEITRVFSAKETLFKALYPQVRAIKEFSAARAIWNGDALSLALTEPWAEALPEGLVFAIEQRVAAGVVVSLLSGIAPDAPST